MQRHEPQFVFPRSAQRALGFDRLWERIETHCSCVYGVEELNDRPFCDAAEDIEMRMAEVLAAKEFLNKQNFTLLTSLTEIRPYLDGALKEEVLSASELKEIAQSLVIMSRLKHALQAGGAAPPIDEYRSSNHRVA